VFALGLALSLVAGGGAQQWAADRTREIDSLFAWLVLLGGLVTSVPFKRWSAPRSARDSVSKPNCA
jgi:hypothetical protein